MAKKFLDLNGVTYLWGKIKEKFVEQEAGKQLSTNDYTTAEKQKLAGLANYTLPKASPSVLGGVKVGAGLSIDSQGILSAKGGGVADSVAWDNVTGKPTKLSQFTNDSGFQTSAQVNTIVDGKGFLKSVPAEYVTDTELTGKGYQTASQVQASINNAISGVAGIEFSVVSSLPSTGEKGVIYLVSNGGSTKNIYDEYIWVTNKFEKLGTTEIDLTPYLKKTDMVEISNSEIDAICS